MLYRDRKYLTAACRIMQYYYSNGGGKFYAIELPILTMTNALKEAVRYFLSLYNMYNSE